MIDFDKLHKRTLFVLGHYHELKRACIEKRVERKAKKGRPEVRAEGYVSDPTGKEAELNSEPIVYVFIANNKIVVNPEEWIACVDRVMETLSEEDQKLVKLAFWSRLSYKSILEELHMDKVTYYRRRDRIIFKFATAAACSGLVE